MKTFPWRLLILLVATTACGAQNSPSSKESPKEDPVAVTLTQMTAVRDSFVKETQASGLPCAIAVPKIIVHDVPTFGSYDPDTNTLTTPAWEQMGDEEQAPFYRLAGPNSKESSARAEFRIGVQHWVFVHELGHWWEACRGVVDREDHYDFELQADKIAAAYWNEHDPSVIAHQQAVFELIMSKWPNPAPPGEPGNTYFNKNYEALVPTRSYIWFQAQMCLTAFRQRPIPPFATALSQMPHP